MTAPRGLVVVGASAGGVEALRALVAGLPVGLEAAICVVLHIPRDGSSALPQILSRSGPLPAKHATDGVALEAGRIYVAPANAHILVDNGHLRLSRGPTENGHRPAIDPLFRSAARSWGASAVGVVLSGSRDDGTFGLATLARHGGLALVQDPTEALYPSMPMHAAEQVPTARAVSVTKMGPILAELLDTMHGPSPTKAPDGAQLAAEDAMAAMENVTADQIGATPAGFGCPSCHGALFELPTQSITAGQPMPRFRCRVGHAWSAAGLLAEQGDGLEVALWTALRSLEEKAALSRRMAASAGERGSSSTAARYHDIGSESESASRVIRQLIEQIGSLDRSDAIELTAGDTS